MTIKNPIQILTDIANAIREKDQTTTRMTPEQMPARIRAINSRPAKPLDEMADVIFFDIDGAILHAYTRDEFLALTALPKPPNAYQWNYPSLNACKQYVTDHGGLSVGLTILQSGFWMNVELTEGALKPYVGIATDATGNIEVNWGDGSKTTKTVNSTSSLNVVQWIGPHEYSEAGKYTISISSSRGNLVIMSNTNYSSLLRGTTSDSDTGTIKAYLNAIKSVHIGNDIYLGKYAFASCEALETAYFTQNVTFASNGTYLFNGCSALKAVAFRTSSTSVGAYQFYGCYSLKHVSIYYGEKVTTGDYMFQDCKSLKRVELPENQSYLGRAMFKNCPSLERICLSKSMSTSSGNMEIFAYDYNLRHIDLPSNLTYIPEATFIACVRLDDIRVPATVTNIYTRAFLSLPSVNKIYFTEHTKVPTLANSAAFISSDTANHYRIVVPMVLFNNWISATNWISAKSIIIFEGELLINWLGYDSSIIDTRFANGENYSTVLSAGNSANTATKPPLGRTGYDFSSWVVGNVEMTGENTGSLNITPQFTTYVLPPYTARFLDEDGETVLETVTVNERNGTPVYSGQTDFPLNEPVDGIEQGTGTVLTWSPTVGPIADDKDYTAVYKSGLKYALGAVGAVSYDTTAYKYITLELDFGTTISKSLVTRRNPYYQFYTIVPKDGYAVVFNVNTLSYGINAEAYHVNYDVGGGARHDVRCNFKSYWTTVSNSTLKSTNYKTFGNSESETLFTSSKISFWMYKSDGTMWREGDILVLYMRSYNTNYTSSLSGTMYMLTDNGLES